MARYQAAVLERQRLRDRAAAVAAVAGGRAVVDVVRRVVLDPGVEVEFHQPGLEFGEEAAEHAFDQDDVAHRHPDRGRGVPKQQSHHSPERGPDGRDQDHLGPLAR